MLGSEIPSCYFSYSGQCDSLKTSKAKVRTNMIIPMSIVYVSILYVSISVYVSLVDSLSLPCLACKLIPMSTILVLIITREVNPTVLLAGLLLVITRSEQLLPDYRTNPNKRIETAL